jgi:hypothetical protein
MKKLFILIVLAFTVSATIAQTATYRMNQITFKEVNTDYTLTNAVAQNFVWNAGQNWTCTQDFLVNLDSLAGNHTNVAVALYGKKFSTSAYAQIGSTVNWAGTTSDTTIVISNATANRYRFYKVIYTGTGTGTSTIDIQAMKLYYE